MPTLSVQFADRTCPILIEAGALASLGRVVRDHAPHRRAILFVDAAIETTHGAVAADALRGSGYDVTTTTLIADEKRKTLETVRSLYESMLAARLDRSSPVIALGGGIIGDIAGFAAATYLRGVPLIQVPTTLLAMVDASIGGKTGVNHPLPGGGLGKNLIGAFWQPRAVVADPLVLQSLKDRDFRCGLAECLKHGLIEDASLLQEIEDTLPAILQRDTAALTRLIHRSAAIKARIVATDERETGLRALLNLGHTFGHAIEAQPDLHVQHGEAVAIGLVAAAHCAQHLNRLAPDVTHTIAALVERCGLPARLPAPVSVTQLMQAMAHDKKVVNDQWRLILPSALGRSEITTDVGETSIRAAWTAVGGT